MGQISFLRQESDLDRVRLGDLFKGVLNYRTHALAVHQHIGYGVSLIRNDGKSLILIFPNAHPAVGSDGTALSGRGVNDVIIVGRTAGNRRGR